MERTVGAREFGKFEVELGRMSKFVATHGKKRRANGLAWPESSSQPASAGGWQRPRSSGHRQGGSLERDIALDRGGSLSATALQTRADVDTRVGTHYRGSISPPENTIASTGLLSFEHDAFDGPEIHTFTDVPEFISTEMGH